MTEDLNLDDGTLVIDFDANKVGIGESAPEYKLEILDAATQLLLSYSNGVDASFGFDSAGNLRIQPSGATVSLGTANLLLSGNINTSGNIQAANISGTWTGAEIADAYIANNITASNYLPLSGGTISGNLTVDNILTTTTLQIGSAYALPSEDGAANYILRTNGANKVYWSADIDTDTNTTYTGGTNLTLDGTEFNVDDVFIKLTGDITGAMTEDLNLDDGTLVIDFDVNKVGIGETVPEYKLEILDAATQLLLRYSNGVDASFGVDSSGNLRIQPSGTTVSLGTANLLLSGNINTSRNIQAGTITGTWTGAETGDT